MLSSCAWLPACCLLCVWPVVSWCVVVPVFRSLSSWLPRPLSALATAAHGGSPFWCPRGLALVSLCSLHLPSPLPLARSAFLAPSFWCSALPLCLMSRGDELRQLAAQLSVLAALEDSIALGLSRVMGPAGSGRSAAPPDAGLPSVPAATAAPSVVPSPSYEVAASLLRSATLTSASSRARTRSRSPAPLPQRAPRRSSSTAWLAESGLVTGLATKCCPPVPPPQLHLSSVSRALHAASVGSQPPVDACGPSTWPRPVSWWRRGRRRPAGRRRWS